MNQVKVGFKLFFQSIVFTFKHAQLFLYIGAYVTLHHLLNYFLFPSLNIDVQSLNEGINVSGSYTAGITSSFSLLFLLGILFNLFSFLLFYVLIIGIIDYTSHILHNQSETIMHSIKKGFSKFGSILGYGLLKIAFVLCSLFSLLAIYALLTPGILSPLLIVIIFYLIYEALTFYFFPAVALSNIGFFGALTKSWHMVLKTFLIIIVFLVLWGILEAVYSFFMPAFAGSMLARTIVTALVSIFAYTIFTVFKTILYEKINGTLPKAHDPE